MDEKKRLVGRDSKAKNGAYIRELTFGVEDGLVSTLGFVVGMTTAAVSSRIIIIGGIAEVVAAGISMAAGTYLSIKSQAEFFSTIKKKIRGGYDIHLENPPKAASIMFFSFIVMALIPLLPYFFLSAERAITLSVIGTIAALFIFGSVKSLITKRSWIRSGVEMTAVGLIAALAGYLVGLVAKTYFGI